MKNTRRSRRPSDLAMVTMRIVIVYFAVATLWTAGDLLTELLFHDPFDTPAHTRRSGPQAYPMSPKFHRPVSSRF